MCMWECTCARPRPNVSHLNRTQEGGTTKRTGNVAMQRINEYNIFFRWKPAGIRFGCFRDTFEMFNIDFDFILFGQSE